MERLPIKLIKLFVFAGIGAGIDHEIGSLGLATIAATGLGMVSNVAVGAGDEFLISRLGSGWKQNQFIESAARDFLEGEKPD